MKKDVVKITDINTKQGLEKFISQPIAAIAEFMTGFLASSKNDYILSAGKLFQAGIKGCLFQQLGEELKEYVRKGEIKKNYLETDFNRSSFKQLLEFIDSETPDEVRFKAMKSIFFYSIQKQLDSTGETICYLLMNLCKNLSSGEILILKAAYEIANGKNIPELQNVDFTSNSVQNWLNNVAKQAGLEYSQLAEIYEEGLMKKRLIGGRRYQDKSGITAGPKYRLTDLGVKLCEIMEEYENEK